MYPDTPQTDFAESFWPHIQMVDIYKIHSRFSLSKHSSDSESIFSELIITSVESVSPFCAFEDAVI